jgi:F-type H+-transporting ATPase subunit alpha
MIVSISSSVVNIEGIYNAMVGEVLNIQIGPGKYSQALVVNIQHNRRSGIMIGGLLINPSERISVGSAVYRSNRLCNIPLGDSLLGSMLDPLGSIIFQDKFPNRSSELTLASRWLIESPAPGIISRQSVSEPLQTGIIAIDSMIPIGRGQRELIVGDRQTGKTSIGVDTILNQKYESVLCVYAPIGQKASSIMEVYTSLAARDATFYVTLFVASASSSALCQYLVAYSATSLAEFFMYTAGLPSFLTSFLMLDDLSKHAVAYREIYLLLKRPPGREAYPGEIFYVHSRLIHVYLKDQLSCLMLLVVVVAHAFL